MSTNEPNGTSTENEEVVEIVEEVSETTDTDEETTGESEDKKELTDEQKKGIAKRNLKKMRKQFPDLFDTEESTEEVKVDTPNVLTRSEAILVAKGLDEAGLEKVNRIAKLDGISIEEAYSSEDFTIWQEKQKREKERKATQLGASGSKAGRVVKNFQTEQLPDEDHEKLFKQFVNKKFRA